MDGGIPDCLLEGLGFYKNPDGETGRDNDESVAYSKVGENSDVQGTLSANNGLKGSYQKDNFAFVVKRNLSSCFAKT